jgi:hypothetical protein
VNLRFPSTGESSGALARALAAGTCCAVTDTAAYAELPRDAVLHIPAPGAVPALAAALAALRRDPAPARATGAAGQAFARREMALPAIAARYAGIIEATRRAGDPAAPPPREDPPLLRAIEAGPALRAAALRDALAGIAGPCRLFLGARDAEALAALTLDHDLPALLPPEARLRALRVQSPPARPGLLLEIEMPDWRRRPR